MLDFVMTALCVGILAMAAARCICCKCTLTAPFLMPDGSSVLSGTWVGTTSSLGFSTLPAFRTSGPGAVRFPNLYDSGEQGATIRWEVESIIGGGGDPRPYLVRLIAAYTDDDNYLFAELELIPTNVVTLRLYERIAGVERQLGQEAKNPLNAFTYPFVEVTWNGTGAFAGTFDSAQATTSTNACGDGSYSTGGACTINPAIWQAGLEVVSLSNPPNSAVEFVCYGAFRRDDNKLTNTVFGSNSFTCNSTQCCPCEGDYTEEVAVTFAGATASTAPSGCCTNPAILNGQTFILSNTATSSVTRTGSCSGIYYLQTPIYTSSFRFTFQYFRSHGTRSTLRQARHVLYLSQGVCFGCLAGGANTHTGVGLESGLRFDCTNYSHVISGFTQTSTSGSEACLCQLSGLTATVEPVV